MHAHLHVGSTGQLHGSHRNPIVTAPPPPASSLQGSSWAVRRRSYHTHDPHPHTLTAQVRPSDVPYLRPAARYAVWSDKLQVGTPPADVAAAACTVEMLLRCGVGPDSTLGTSGL